MDPVPRSQVALALVARLAGVARATASRVFGGNPGVSPEARAAVKRAAAELGYVPTQVARSLAGGRREAVGVVVPDPQWRGFLGPAVPRRLVWLVGGPAWERLAERALRPHTA